MVANVLPRKATALIIERDLTPYVVYSGDPVLRALEKITANKARVIFLVDSHGHLDGVLSDGDFRRWVSAAATLTTDVPAIEAANTSPRSLPIGSSPAEISHAFGSGIDHVALVDERGHLVAIAINRADELRLGRHVVAPDAPALMVSEIGINHQGEVGLAKQLVDLSVEAGADVVKFQLRDMESLYRQGTSGSGGEDLGPQYTLDLLAKYNLGADDLFEVFDHCRDIGIDVMCTAWDPVSVDRLVDYGITSLKVASAGMTNHALLRHMAASGTPMVISTGMSTEGEIRETVDLIRGTGVAHAFLHCQSTYPAPFKDVSTVTARICGGASPALEAPVAAPDSAAPNMARPPEACTVSSPTPSAAARAAASSTVLGMSWSFRSRKTRSPRSRRCRTRSGPAAV